MGDGSRIADHVPQYLTTADGLAHGATTELAAADATTEARLERRCAGLRREARTRPRKHGWRRAGAGSRLAARRKVRGAGGAQEAARGWRRAVGRTGEAGPAALRGEKRAGGAPWGEAGLAARRVVARVRRGEKRCAGKLGI
jgi:hypothetical protein